MTEVILIGNGTSVLDYELGSAIDAYKTVVRFNNFQTKNYEKHVGTKTNVWFTCGEKHKQSINDFDSVVFHSWADEQNCSIYKNLKKLRPDTIKLQQRHIENTQVKYPSTGLLAIMYFLEKQDSITIYGFDWWEKEDHHYADNEIRGTLHNPLDEHEVIKKLGNRIKFLR